MSGEQRARGQIEEATIYGLVDVIRSWCYVSKNGDFQDRQPPYPEYTLSQMANGGWSIRLTGNRMHGPKKLMDITVADLTEHDYSKES